MLKRLLACAAIALVSIPLHAQAPAAARAEAGWQALQTGDGDRAATAFREALIQNPRDPTLHFGAGVAAHLLGHETDAMESLRRALQLEPRSEEHTSELQSLTNLVCRLLLEKKNKRH